MIQAQQNNFKYRNELLNKLTPAELLVEDWLIKNNIKYLKQKGFLIPFHRIVDFYIPRKKIIIEVDGDYHKLIKNKDALKDFLWLKKRGMKTIRLMNDEVFSGLHCSILSRIL